MTARTRGRASIGRSWIYTRWSGRADATSLSLVWRAGSCVRDAGDDASCWSFSRLPNRKEQRQISALDARMRR